MPFFSHTTHGSCKPHTNRPLSPHLTIYTPQLTSTLSIFHRISGVFLAISFLSLCAFIQEFNLYLTFYPIYWSWCSTIMSLNSLTPNEGGNQYTLHIVSLLYGICVCALSYHLSNGIRHLLWDCGFFLDLAKVYASGIIILICAFTLIFLTLMYTHTF